MKLAVSRKLLWPLVPVYAAVVYGKNWLADRGVPAAKRLGHPVISVGSISAGGAGKTPVVVLLAEALAKRGYEVRILTRGYRRKGIAASRVNPDGNAGEFGDEPLMMARRLQAASVWVGIDRHRVGQMSEDVESPGAKVVYLLDDGFQHRKLARDVDLVLVTPRDLHDRLLPVGNLREPFAALRRADVIVVREDEGEVGSVAGPGPVWAIRRQLTFPEGAVVPVWPVVFCGLARPEAFFSMLRARGTMPVQEVRFRDHHAYRGMDIERLVELARVNGTDGFVTTEKDAVKLTAGMMARLEAVGSVVIAELKVELVDEEAKIKELLEMVTKAK